MHILGINAYHGGASACLIRDGQLVAAAEEERFSRIKYDAGFPVRAIQYVLSAGGITAADLDHVGISRNPNAHLMQMALYAFRRRPSLQLITDRLSNNLKVTSLEQDFHERMGLARGTVRAQFHNVEHHRAHLASAFFVSPFDQAAVLSVDGAGDFVTTMWGVGRGNQLEVSDQIYFPHSLGIFYNALTQWLGFVKYGDEGKVMGLAPYGQPRYLDDLRKIVRVQADGTFELDLDYFVHHAEGASMTWDGGSEPVVGTLYSDRLVKLLGEPRVPRSELTAQHHDVAASLQAMLEEAELALVRGVQQRTGQTALCLAGGVALNSAFNGKIQAQTGFKDLWIHPAAGDAGTSLGVAYYLYHQVLGQPRTFVMQNAYTGPEFDAAHMASVLRAREVAYEELSPEAITVRAADVVVRGDVLGWFQGRMEWGPRALGNRSIIADPRRHDMKDILNARIKHREPFRPFAPSVQAEHTGDWFDQDYPVPFMLQVYGVRADKQNAVPAITHVDGTGRLQTVERDVAPRYWALIEAFRQQTGVPMVLNTSFNENEPIVCTPEEAVDCFLRTRMDALALGNFWVEKRG